MELRSRSRLTTGLATVFAAGALTAVTALPASAQPTTQRGLVNVNAQDLKVQIPIGVAANICGVTANVLATAQAPTDVQCTTEGVAVAQNDSNPSGPVAQDGLVNVNLTDVNVQVPVGIAANVCGVTVNVLAQFTGPTGVDCDAAANSTATNG